MLVIVHLNWNHSSPKYMKTCAFAGFDESIQHATEDLNLRIQSPIGLIAYKERTGGYSDEKNNSHY